MNPRFLLGCLTGIVGATKLARSVLRSRVTSRKRIRVKKKTVQNQGGSLASSLRLPLNGEDEAITSVTIVIVGTALLT